jgi:uncharacterized protein YkwD
MKILSSLGALVLFIALSAGTASVLLDHPASAHALTASTLAVGTASPSAAEAVPSPSADPTSKPRTAAPAPAPRKAAPPRKAAVPVARSVPPAIVVRSTQQVLINRDRARYGLRPLTWSSCLGSIAYSNAYRMARQGHISHTDGPTRDLGCHLGYRAGENVGWWSGGVNDAQINTMFMNSPDHRANVLGPYHYVATAWVTAPNGSAYIAVEFS